MLTLVPAAPPIRCVAPDLLDRAHAAFEANYFAECGCLIRESLRLTLVALCQWHEVKLPRRKVRRTTGELAILLKRGGAIVEDQCAWALEILDVANAAAHCSFVTRRQLASAVREAGWFVNDTWSAKGGDV